MHSHTYRALRGIEVTKENLGYEAIIETVMGDGHFLGGARALSAMERDYFYPSLTDRNQPITWEDQGRRDALDVASERARQVLATHYPEYLSPAQDA